MTSKHVDDLTKPLGIKEDKTGGIAGVKVMASLVALAVAGATAYAGWYYHYGKRETVALTIHNLPVSPQDLAALPATKPAVGDNVDAGQPADTGPAALKQAEANGSIVAMTPIPQMRRQEIGLAHIPDPELIELHGRNILPKRSADNLRPMDVYSRPPATEGNFGVARIVLIVGGLGISQTGTQQAIKLLPGEVTLAFAPYGNSLQRWMENARKSGHEILLQLPMEPFDYPSNNPGRQTLRTDLEASENTANLNWLLARITNYVGVISYLGGKFETNELAMKPVFNQLARRGLLFVDDGSVRNSITEQVAAASLLPYAKAGLHIDAIRDRAKIKERLEELAATAQRTGMAIGYANAFSESIEMIADFARNAASSDIEITPVSAIVTDPERKR